MLPQTILIVILNNIILTTTGAAKALGLVIPEMKNIGFMAESVRIPTSTGSLIVLVLNLQDTLEDPINRAKINGTLQVHEPETHDVVVDDVVGLGTVASCNCALGVRVVLSVLIVVLVVNDVSFLPVVNVGVQLIVQICGGTCSSSSHL